MSINPFWQYEQNWKQNLSATYGIRRSCFIALTPKWYTGCVWLLPSDLSTPEIFWFLVSLPSAFGSLPCLAQTCPCNVKSTSCIDLSVSELGPRPPTRPRILLKAPTLAEMEEMNISEVSWNSVILKGNRKVGSVLFLTAAHALFPNLSLVKIPLWGGKWNSDWEESLSLLHKDSATWEILSFSLLALAVLHQTLKLPYALAL